MGSLKELYERVDPNIVIKNYENIKKEDIELKWHRRWLILLSLCVGLLGLWVGFN